MTEMSNFFVAFLNAIAAFLGSEPIIYLFGLILLCYVCKIFKILTNF